MNVTSTNKWRGALAGRPRQQKGAVTMFSAILILILLTEMLIYAVQVGVFEQRKSGNEMRQKQAFHAAETGIQQAHAYMLANALDLTFTGTDGWLFETYVDDGGSGRWAKCPDSTGPGEHPCFGEPLSSGDPVNLRANSYFYSLDGATPSAIPMVLADILPASTETVAVQAILCLLEVDHEAVGSPPVRGCLDKDDPKVNPIYYIITLLSRGNAECVDDGGGGFECAAEALVAQKLGSFGPLTGAGGPGVPLTTRSSFPPGGTAEIVPNPNGGGPGVPLSSWINDNTTTDPYTGVSCNAFANPLDPNGGSWTTCENHEWYGVDTMPDENSPNGKYTCPSASCSCGTDERRLSYGDANTDVKNFDIIIDPQFPCDLFYYTFNVHRDDYLDVKTGPGVQVINDCNELGPDSRGTIWVDGSVDTCKITATDVGSPEWPVFLISAANLFSLGGNANIYGVLFVTDVEGRNGEYESTGTNTLYGAGIIDGYIGKFSGTYQVVWNDDLIDRATKTGSLGKIYGGWTDFHEDWR
jgi:hypothetical protein